jgi:IS605 OrfB family transposase
MWQPTTLAPEGGIPAYCTDPWSEEQVLIEPYRWSVAHLFKTTLSPRLKAGACAPNQVVISRRIVDAYPASLIGLENLTSIRDRTKRRHGKQATQKQRNANRHASQWAFAELHGYLAYKAALDGSMAVKVDAYCTSQACPRCGHTAPENRPGKGMLFMYRACGFQLYADLVGARNIALRTLLARQAWVSTGVLSERPDVSDDEAKAAQRRRYAELRWSPDTSPQL